MNFFDLRKVADVNSSGSYSNKLRSLRFAHFKSLLEEIPKPIKIIDIGGTLSYWEQRGWLNKMGVYITIINLHTDEIADGNITVKSGNALDLSEYSDKFFDVAYSNSVIEHLYDLDKQLQMAKEVQRIAKSFWIQTPNYWFPIEPHFHIPGWQWLPKKIRVALLMRIRCGWRGPVNDRKEAEELVNEVRLMTMREFRMIFPDVNLWKEKFFGLNKSLVAYKGFNNKKII